MNTYKIKRDGANQVVRKGRYIGSNIRRGATCDRFYDKKKSCTFYGV
jgi:hypothetical protein